MLGDLDISDYMLYKFGKNYLNELEVVIHSNKLGACVYREPLSLNVDFLDGYCICSAKIRGGIDNDINYISKKFKEDLSTKDSC